MSTRTLIEIDHDRLHTIETKKTQFIKDLIAYLHSPTVESGEGLLSDYGISILGQRQHSSPYHIQYGHTHRHDYDGEDL